MKKNKYVNGILPTILINFSIGTVYSWTLLKDDILAYTGFDIPIVEWCFSLAIFVLGMSAAFGGKIVEKNVKVANFITFVMVTLGWAVAGYGIQIKDPIVTILGFGVIQGIGIGFGYLTPVKTLMVWMDKKKGFAAGLAIAGFALAGIIANPMIAFLLERFAIYEVFYILAALFGVFIFASFLLIHRPKAIETRAEFQKTFKIREIIFTKKFIMLWTAFFLMIACGLALISQERQVYTLFGVTSMAVIVFYCSVSAVLNLIGRLTMASLQDKQKRKHLPFYFVTIFSLGVCFIAAFGVQLLPATLLMMWVANFFFGAAFSCLPNILHQNYGFNQLATVHGLLLSAWAVAGLAGNQFAAFVMANYSLSTLYVWLGVFYALALVILAVWSKTCLNKVSVEGEGA
ncbi:MAG: MFS transporter [Oscillospiraceae bacterium]|nr:MFS transporter [Oscillospiraceae bacterium]